MIEQGSLFPEGGDIDGKSMRDIADIAAHIAEHAPEDPYASQRTRQEQIVESRGEDLAAEQTGVSSVTSEVADTPDAEQATVLPEPSPRTRPYELPGRRHGRSNTQGTGSPREAQRGLSAAEIERRHAEIRAHTSDIRQQLRLPPHRRRT